MKLSEIVESSSISEQTTDLIDPNADLPAYVPEDNEEMFEGEHKTGMSPSDAKEYLDRYPFGSVNHTMYETESFIFKTESGKYYFWNAGHKDPNNSITVYDWVKDVEEIEKDTLPNGEYEDEEVNDFYYNPGYEFGLRSAGMNWFRELRKLK